jgi:elongation factor 1-gamma
MDEFKRVYSNEDTEKVAIPHFWAKFEKEFYSMWFCEYKYADELALTFMSSNLVGGMFQRIERLRKNAFGSMCVFGENNKNTICGVWVWRGQDLVFPVSF